MEEEGGKGRKYGDGGRRDTGICRVGGNWDGNWETKDT